MHARVFTDGAARGNPGPAAYGYVIEPDGAPAVEGKAQLGVSTNNRAEYAALVAALTHAQRMGLRRLSVYSDSELLVKQMNGEYKVKSNDLRDLWEQARTLSRTFDLVKIQHVRRAENARADRLCNEVLDQVPAAPQRENSACLDREAVAILEEAASAWSAGATQPSAADVWQRLRQLIRIQDSERR